MTMTIDEAVDIVARNVLDVLLEWDGPEWESYPDLGEHDWTRVLARISALLPAAPAPEEYEAAYQLLTDRAEATA